MLGYSRDDETLVMLTLVGDQSAYEALVIKYRSAVINSALAVTKNMFMAEDAAQDAFVTAWIKLNTLREPHKFGGWVCRIARNCALNTVMRYKSVMPLDDIPWSGNDDRSLDPVAVYEDYESSAEVNDSVNKLPEKIRKTIYLHYFEGLSIAEIADKMRVSEGTVKSQLHDGRKKIRRELCAMNEKWNDTFIQRVMKKVEELKMWQLKSSKDGFEKAYKVVLKEVDNLPESIEKSHALADVLMRGWWWLPGTKNDALFDRIRNAAEEGKNDEVMSFIVNREALEVSQVARAEFIREKQIPRLEKGGFKTALAKQWKWLADIYYSNKQIQEGEEAFTRVKEYDAPGGVARSMVDNCRKVFVADFDLEGKNKDEYYIRANATELRYIDGNAFYWDSYYTGRGWMGFTRNASDIFTNASRCDGKFFEKGLAVGESICGSDGSLLTYVSECEKAETPCGVFENCKVWRVCWYSDYVGKTVCTAYYKEGIGIVKFEHKNYGLTQERLLKSYTVSGDGLLPLEKGNRWEYDCGISPENLKFALDFEVSYVDESKAIINSYEYSERIKYDENSWTDMMFAIRYGYCDDKDVLHDVYYPVKRAEELAKTPIEKAHAKAAASTAKRILETDAVFTPNRVQSGHWNFFHKDYTHNEKGRVIYEHNGDWSFEWKMGPLNNASEPLLYNDIYGILQDAASCIWSEEWQVGASPVVEYFLLGRRNVKTQIVCNNEESVETKAGVFKNCLKLSLNISGMNDGWSYRGGNKIYWFAEGVGIVKALNEYCGGARSAVYELVEYNGTGDGFMPIKDGLFRKYAAIGLTDGYIGEAEYTYVADEDGDVFIITERTGIRNIPSPISCYSSIEGEIIEAKLWNEKKRDEARLRHEINNFNILLHYLGRTQRYYAAPKKALEWGRHSLKMIELLGEGGEVPKAWLGRYGEMFFRTACFIFGNSDADKNEGYAYLEKAFEIYLEWKDIPVGTPLDVGNADIYGGIKYLKDKSQILLPDGRIEAIEYGGILEYNAKFIYNSLIAKYGWEWFDSVRNEERFKAFTEKIMLYKNKETK